MTEPPLVPVTWRRLAVLAVCVLSAACESGRPDEPSIAVELADSMVLGFTAAPLFAAGAGSVVLLDVHASDGVLIPLDSGTARRIGRPGRGPGEITTPLAVAAGEGVVTIVDMANMRATVFDEAGQHLGSTGLPGLPVQLLYAARDSFVLIWARPGRDAGPTIGSVHHGTGEVRVWFEVFEVLPQLAAGATPGRASPFLTASLAADGSVLLGQGRQYAFYSVTREGRLVQSFGRPDLPARLPSRAERMRFEANLELLRAQPPGLSPDLARELISEFSRTPQIFFTTAGLAIDPDGRYWVITTLDESGDGTIIHRYSVVGEYEGEVRLPGRVKGLAFTPPHRMLTLNRQGGHRWARRSAHLPHRGIGPCSGLTH